MNLSHECNPTNKCEFSIHCVVCRTTSVETKHTTLWNNLCCTRPNICALNQAFVHGAWVEYKDLDLFFEVVNLLLNVLDVILSDTLVVVVGVAAAVAVLLAFAWKSHHSL